MKMTIASIFPSSITTGSLWAVARDSTLVVGVDTMVGATLVHYIYIYIYNYFALSMSHYMLNKLKYKKYFLILYNGTIIK